MIEYIYPKSPSVLIDRSRGFREASKLRLLLNALLIPSIDWISPRTVGTLGYHWTVTSAEPSKVEYLQESYHYADTAPPDTFSVADRIPRIPEVSPEEYYRERHIPLREPFDLPSDLGLTLDQFFSLDDTSQTWFLRGCYWLSQATKMQSFSLMLLTAVQAIEALIRAPSGSRQCPTCGLSMGPGPTKLFNTFLELFLPESMKSKEGLQTLYRARSALTHGSSLLLADIEAFFGGITPMHVNQRETVAEALRFARMCLRNWLNCEPFIHGHVAEAAFFLWQRDAYQHGRDREHWSQAIADIRGLAFLDV